MELLELVVHLLIELLVQHMQTTLQHEVLVLQQHLLVVIEVGVQHQRVTEVVQHIVLHHELVVNQLHELLVTHMQDVVLQR